MQPATFGVTIVPAGGATNGFIDQMTIERYMASGSTPTTLAQTTTKRAANMRFAFLQQQLQFEGNIYITDVEATGGTATTAPTSFSFTATVERGLASLTTKDETNGTVLTGAAALKRMVARSMLVARTTVANVYDPTLTAAKGDNAPATAARVGTRITTITVPALAATLAEATGRITIVGEEGVASVDFTAPENSQYAPLIV